MLRQTEMLIHLTLALPVMYSGKLSKRVTSILKDPTSQIIHISLLRHNVMFSVRETVQDVKIYFILKNKVRFSSSNTFKQLRYYCLVTGMYWNHTMLCHGWRWIRSAMTGVPVSQHTLWCWCNCIKQWTSWCDGTNAVLLCGLYTRSWNRSYHWTKILLGVLMGNSSSECYYRCWYIHNVPRWCYWFNIECSISSQCDLLLAKWNNKVFLQRIMYWQYWWNKFSHY